MTDQVLDVSQQPAAPADVAELPQDQPAQPAEASPEQIAAINLFVAKQSQVQKISQHFMDFKQAVQGLMMPEYHKHQALVNIDNAYLWIKEGITAFKPAPPQKITPSQPQASESAASHTANDSAANETAATAGEAANSEAGNPVAEINKSA